MPVRLGCHLSAQQIEAGTLRTQLAFPNRWGLPSYHRAHLHKPPSEGEQTAHCELLPGTAANLGFFSPLQVTYYVISVLPFFTRKLFCLQRCVLDACTQAEMLFYLSSHGHSCQQHWVFGRQEPVMNCK